MGKPGRKATCVFSKGDDRFFKATVFSIALAMCIDKARTVRYSATFMFCHLVKCLSGQESRLVYFRHFTAFFYIFILYTCDLREKIFRKNIVGAECVRSGAGAFLLKDSGERWAMSCCRRIHKHLPQICQKIDTCLNSSLADVQHPLIKRLMNHDELKCIRDSLPNYQHCRFLEKSCFKIRSVHLCPPCLSTMTHHLYTSMFSFAIPPALAVSLMKNHYWNKGFCI